jgi:hypothetical protein
MPFTRHDDALLVRTSTEMLKLVIEQASGAIVNWDVKIRVLCWVP